MAVKNRILIGVGLMFCGANVSAQGAMDDLEVRWFGQPGSQQVDSIRDLPERSEDDAPCRCPKARLEQEELHALQDELDKTQDALYRAQQASGYAKVDLDTLERCLHDKKDKSQCMGIARQLRRSLLKARGPVTVYVDSSDLSLFLRDAFWLKDGQKPDNAISACPVMDNLIRDADPESIAGDTSTDKAPDA